MPFWLKSTAYLLSAAWGTVLGSGKAKSDAVICLLRPTVCLLCGRCCDRSALHVVSAVGGGGLGALLTPMGRARPGSQRCPSSQPRPCAPSAPSGGSTLGNCPWQRRGLARPLWALGSVQAAARMGLHGLRPSRSTCPALHLRGGLCLLAGSHCSPYGAACGARLGPPELGEAAVPPGRLYVRVCRTWSQAVGTSLFLY